MRGFILVEMNGEKNEAEKSAPLHFAARFHFFRS